MITYISEATVRKHLDEKKAFRLAGDVFRLVAGGKTKMPPKIYLEVPRLPTSDFRAMPAFIEAGKEGICGVKWVSVFPDNRRFGLPTVNATILLNSPVNGKLVAILEGNTITGMRTGAASALAARYLANPRPKKLAIVGAGLQAEYQLRALAALYTFKEICVWGYKHHEAEAFCRSFLRKIKNLKASGRIKDCVADADIVVTCTPSRKPLVQRSWIKKGAHVNAIGADAKGKEELDPALLRHATVVVDEWKQASHSGEINVPVSRGIFSKRNLCAELAEIVAAKKRGRRSAEEITIFDSTGLAILDIYFAKYIYDACRKRKS